MAHKVQKLEKREGTDGCNLPHRCFLEAANQVDLRSDAEAAKDPVMETINKRSPRGHRVTTENVDEARFEDPLQVMGENHPEGALLHKGVFGAMAEEVEPKENEDRPDILCIEDGDPEHLGAKVFDYKGLAILEAEQVERLVVIVEDSLEILEG